MGKYVRRCFIGTANQFNERVPQNNDITEIKNARIYWNDVNGTIMVIASQEWKDYLTGKSDVRPEN